MGRLIERIRLAESAKEEHFVWGEDWYDAMDDAFGDITYSKREGSDFRLDFTAGYSLRLRGGKSVEGTAKKAKKAKLEKLLRELGLKSDVKYV